MKIKKKIMVSIMVAALAAATLTGCGNQAQPADTSAEVSDNPTGTAKNAAGLEGKWLCGAYDAGGEELGYEQLVDSGCLCNGTNHGYG